MARQEYRQLETPVLIVDDDTEALQSLSRLVRRFCGTVYTAQNIEAAEKVLKDSAGPLLVLLDLYLVDGQDSLALRFLDTLRRERPFATGESAVVIMSAYATVEQALQFLGDGIDYLHKPIINPVDVNFRLCWAEQNLKIRQSLRSAGLPKGVVGKSPLMLQIFEYAREVLAFVDEPIMVVGETGTGKEILAKMIHEWSGRPSELCESVSCGALSDPMAAQSALFGHVEGAYTGAIDERPGAFFLAGDGTVILHDLQNLPNQVQGELLQCLQECEYTPLGGGAKQRLTACLIASINEEPDDLIAAGQLKSDFKARFFHVVNLPSLRDRGPEEILVFAQYYCNQHMEKRRKKGMPLYGTVLSPEVAKLLQEVEYHWPENIRELRNVVTAACNAAVVRKDKVVIVKDLLFAVNRPSPGFLSALKEHGPGPNGEPKGDLKPAQQAERNLILAALSRNDGNREKTAKDLGYTRETLWRRMKKYGLLPSKDANPNDS